MQTRSLSDPLCSEQQSQKMLFNTRPLNVYDFKGTLCRSGAELGVVVHSYDYDMSQGTLMAKVEAAVARKHSGPTRTHAGRELEWSVRCLPRKLK